MPFFFKILTPQPQEGCDTRSIFEQNKIGLNFLQSCSHDTTTVWLHTWTLMNHLS